MASMEFLGQTWCAMVDPVSWKSRRLGSHASRVGRGVLLHLFHLGRSVRIEVNTVRRFLTFENPTSFCPAVFLIPMDAHCPAARVALFAYLDCDDLFRWVVRSFGPR